MRWSCTVILSCLVPLSLVACGSSQPSPTPPAPADRADAGAGSAPFAPGAPASEADCRQLLDRLVFLLRSESNARARAAHDARQKELARQAEDRGEPVPEAEAFDERTLYTDEDAALAKQRLEGDFLEQCMKEERRRVRCGISASSLDQLRNSCSLGEHSED